MAEISNMVGVPTVAPDTRAPDDYQQIQPKAGAGLQAIGAGLTDASKLLGKINTDSQVNQFTQTSTEALSDFEAKQGQDAVGARNDLVASIQAQRQQLRSNLPDAESQLAFDDATRSYTDRFLQPRIDQHYDQQNVAYGKATNAATISQSLAPVTANPSDPATINTALASVRTAMGKNLELEGNGGDPVLRQHAQDAADGMVLRAQIDAMGVKDPTGAAALADQHRNLLGVEYAPIAERLQTKALDQTADTRLASIVPMPGIAPGPSASLIQATATDLGVDPIQAATVAHIETLGGTVPDRPGSSHTGVFQLGPAEFAAGGGTTRGDPAQEVRAGIVNIKAAQDTASAALGQPASPADGYLVYQQGKAGGTALLKADPGANVVDALAPAYGGNRQAAFSAITSNGGDATGTAGQFRSLIGTRYAAAEQQARGGMLQHDYPDVAGLEAKTVQAAGGNPQLERLMLSRLHERLQVAQAQADAAKQQLSGTLGGISAGLLAGDSSITIPESTIRAAMPAPEAERQIADLHDAQQAGQLIKGLRWAPPTQVATTMADLATPDGRLSRTLRGQSLAQGGTPDGAALPPETPDQVLRRQRIAAAAQSALEARTNALRADPVSYVSENPAVAAAATSFRANPEDPGAASNYYATSLALQQRLGLEPWQTHLLTAGQAQGLTARINNVDPSKEDVGGLLAAQAKTYGQYWPQAFRDMVTLGKLDPRYQTLATMDAPGQTLARGDLQRALQAQAVKGAAGKDVRSGVPTDVAKDIDAGLDDKLADFRRTASIPGLSANGEMFGMVRDSVRTLADYYGTQGLTADQALSRATDGILGQKYDFDGTIRAPKGTISQVERTTSTTLDALKPSDIAVTNTDPIVGSLRQTDLYHAVQRAKWVPNENDDGLVAVAPLNNGAMWPVRLSNGQRLELRFANLGKPSPITLPSAIAPRPIPAPPGRVPGSLPPAPTETMPDASMLAGATP